MWNPETVDAPLPQDEPESRPGGLPLYVWVIAAVIVAIPARPALGRRGDVAGDPAEADHPGAHRAGRALVVLAILSAIVTNEIHGRQGALMMVFYLINTLVAMVIGLAPDEPDPARPRAPRWPTRHSPRQPLAEEERHRPPRSSLCPRSIGEAFAQNNLAQLVLLTLALGDRPGEDPRCAAGPGRDLVSGGGRPADHRLRAADAGPALGGRAGAAGGARHRGVERRPEGRDAGLPCP